MNTESQQAEDAHRLEACENLSREGRKHFHLIEFDANEQLVTEIRKHSIGLLLIIFVGVFVSTVIVFLAMFLSSSNLNSISAGATTVTNIKGPVIMISFLLLVLTVIGTLIGVFIYTSNVIYVTSEKIAQVQYASLFNRKISQLSIGDVQDVSVQQKGIIAHIFNYGTLVIETAGEQQNYTFTFVPRPYENSKHIVGAHERNLVQYGN